MNITAKEKAFLNYVLYDGFANPDDGTDFLGYYDTTSRTVGGACASLEAKGIISVYENEGTDTVDVDCARVKKHVRQFNICAGEGHTVREIMELAQG